jgi:hypothetical protein
MITKLCLLLIIIASLSSPAFSAGPEQLEDSSAKIAPNPPGHRSIQALQIMPKLFTSVQSDSYIVLGKYFRPNWTLTYNNGTKINFLKNNSFPIVVKIGDAKKTSIQLTATGPKGEIEEQTIILTAPNKKPESRQAYSKPGADRGSLGIALTSATYTQTLAPKISAKNVIVKGGYDIPFNAEWDFKASTDITALPISTTPKGATLRSLWLNGVANYALNTPSAEWRFFISGGLYYTTMFSSGLNIGYRNLTGLQIKPNLQYGRISAYFKYAPNISNFKIVFSDKEIALGVAYALNLHYSIEADYRAMNATISATKIDTKSINLGVLYTF